MVAWRYSFPGCIAALMVVLLSGCADGPSIVPVTGILTHKGKPVTNAHIDFVPEVGRPSSGQTDERGWFQLDYDPQNKGAVVGKHKVSVRKRLTTPAEEEAIRLGKAPSLSPEMTAFFKKYSAEQSKVEVVVESGMKELNLAWD